MPIRIPTSEFFEDAGGQAQDFVSQLADRIPRFACELWRTYPKFLTNARNPATSYVRGYMNNMCAPIQPPVPPPELQIESGQCEVVYIINIVVDVFPNTASCERSPDSQSSFSVRVWGKIGRIEVINPAGECGGFTTLVVECHGISSEPRQLDQFQFVVSEFSFGRFLRVNSVAIAREDGLPDDCGNAVPTYPPEVPPAPPDLNTTINIFNIDGLNLEIPLTWNQGDINFNFPMSWDIGGINATLDIGGLTLNSNANLNIENNLITRRITSLNNIVVIVSGQNGQTVVPDIVAQDLVPSAVEYVECDGGELTDKTSTVGVTKGSEAAYKLIIELLTALLREACLNKVDLGLPEIYPVLPGVERPVIMYYFKENLGGKRGQSTYVSTLPNPTEAAINEIEDVNVPNRFLGKFVLSIKLLDGSRIVARGVDKEEAESYFSFLLLRTLPRLLPDNVDDEKILTENQRLEAKEVECSQIEYYPHGTNFARSPSVRRFIKFE